MVRTIEQQVAEAQAKLARLKTRAKAQDTRRKIIVGAIVTTEALKDPKIAKWLARDALPASALPASPLR